jgi:hypothetical protein
MFDTFSTDDILKDWHWKGNRLSDEQIYALKEHAKTFATSTLWKVLKAELQWYALKSLVEKGKDENDIRFARAFGNIVQQIDSKLMEMSK